MKKWFVAAGVFVLLASGAAWCQAEDQPESKDSMKMSGQGMMGEGMMGRGMMMEHKKGMDRKAEKMKMKIMMPKEMVGTPDGGVIVMVGNKLLKYDKNLDLKKEVEIKVDWAGMKTMKRNCPEKCEGNDCPKDYQKAESGEKSEKEAGSKEQ